MLVASPLGPVISLATDSWPNSGGKTPYHFQSDQKVVGYSYDIWTTIASLTISWYMNHSRNLHGSQLGETDDWFSPRIEYIALLARW